MPRSNKATSTFVIEDASEEFKTKYFDQFCHPHVVNYVFGLVNSLEYEKFKVTEINRKSLWLVKVSGKAPDGSDFVIALNYNKKGIPGMPRVERPNQSVEKFITGVTEATPELSLPSDFREEVYNKWFTNLKTSGWSLEAIEVLEWMDRVAVKNHSAWCVFDIQYNSEGFISIVKPFKASSKEGWSEVVAILKHANDV